jgi:DNA-directed RNA polymerase delta subunit
MDIDIVDTFRNFLKKKIKPLREIINQVSKMNLATNTDINSSRAEFYTFS